VFFKFALFRRVNYDDARSLIWKHSNNIHIFLHLVDWLRFVVTCSAKTEESIVYLVHWAYMHTGYSMGTFVNVFQPLGGPLLLFEFW